MCANFVLLFVIFFKYMLVMLWNNMIFELYYLAWNRNLVWWFGIGLALHGYGFMS